MANGWKKNIKINDFTVIIPHLGSATVKTRDNMAIIGAMNVLAGLAGIPMNSPVF